MGDPQGWTHTGRLPIWFTAGGYEDDGLLQTDLESKDGRQKQEAGLGSENFGWSQRQPRDMPYEGFQRSTSPKVQLKSAKVKTESRPAGCSLADNSNAAAMGPNAAADEFAWTPGTDPELD